MSDTCEGWAAWHPTKGFESYGSLANSDVDDVCRQVRELNEEAGSNNRNGWRAVRVRVERL